MKRAILGLVAACLVSLASVAAHAQAMIVASCGTVPASMMTLTAGNQGPFFIDTTGKLCTSSTGGGGGAATIADGADVAEGATADAAATVGSIGTLSAKLRLMTSQLDTLNTTLKIDPCQGNAKTYTPITITTNTTTKIITGASAKKTYICHLLLTSAAADNVGIVEGTTGGTCGSGTAGMIGGTTAANGPNFAANGGLSIGNGGYAVAATATNQNDVCLITSAATPLAGVVSWVQQ